MKVSEISLDDMLRQCHIVKEYLTDDDEALLNIYKETAISYAKSDTGLDDEGLDQYDDIAGAVLMLIEQFYDNRQAETSSNDSFRQTFDVIMGHHRVNLL